MEVDYESYKAENFLDDTKLIEWVKYRSPELEKFWSEWVASQPTNIAAFKEAEKQLTIILSAERIEPSIDDQEDVLQKILRSINDAEEKVIPMPSRFRRWIMTASAAAIIIISGAVWFATTKEDAKTEFTTAYGEMKRVVLPDQSEVTMNAHSHIAFKPDWNNGTVREVWLDGEANFNVKHLNKSGTPIKESEKFIIHVGMLEVEVLGTVFNVKERRGKVEVSLESGSIQVQVKDKKDKRWLLKPNEVAVYSNKTGVLQKLINDPVIYKAWTDKKMLTNNTSVGEIVQAIEDQYGLKVILEDAELADRRIDGTIPFKSESNVLFVLSNILDIDIEKKDSLVIFKSKK